MMWKTEIRPLPTVDLPWERMNVRTGDRVTVYLDAGPPVSGRYDGTAWGFLYVLTGTERVCLPGSRVLGVGTPLPDHEEEGTP